MYKKIIVIVIICSLISAIAGFWIFEMDWLFLPFPLLTGLAVIFAQKEQASYKFINKLLIGSLFYGFLAQLFIFSRMYFLFSGFPFWPFYNPKEYIIFSLIFSFISLLGGLAGIVIKGFYIILKKSDERSLNVH